jgi:excisionase family DNA binding protein
MIDLASEKLLTLEQAAERLLVNKATVCRWITSGSNGVYLEGIRLGTRWRTSEEALQRFGERLTPNREAASSPQPRFLTSKQRQRQIDEANEQLDEWFGVKKCETCRVKLEPRNVVIPKNTRLWCPQCIVKRRSATLGQRIRMFRWSTSLSLSELSVRSAMGVDFIRAYEYDERKPSKEHLAKLLEVLGQTLICGLKGYEEEVASSMTGQPATSSSPPLEAGD